VILFKHSLEYCYGGAPGDCNAQEAYLDAIESAGFTVNHQRVNAYEFISDRARTASAKYGVKSISLLATKTKI
jgi:arsenite methyltransferase